MSAPLTEKEFRVLVLEAIQDILGLVLPLGSLTEDKIRDAIQREESAALSASPAPAETTGEERRKAEVAVIEAARKYAIGDQDNYEELRDAIKRLDALEKDGAKP